MKKTDYKETPEYRRTRAFWKAWNITADVVFALIGIAALAIMWRIFESIIALGL